MQNKTRNIPLSIDDETLANLDRVAADLKESRSYVMRKAIREGLPLVKSGGDVLTLDSELSADVDQVSKEAELSRNRVLLEAIRMGLEPLYAKTMREKAVAASEPEEAESILAMWESADLFQNPMSREVRTACQQRGAMFRQLQDILHHVPEAKRRSDLMQKLAELRRQPGGMGGGMPWGLSLEEIERQIEMHTKYGPNAAEWPESANASAPKKDAPDSTPSAEPSKSKKRKE